ncbi:rCG37842 [Rattus norvegicus]|uniref:RCG37842 n=1 Tax=Rattus norvegicus TaxID=10116 RepID=A6K5Q5_RAT|nr:rCG37842 [Rattus norvegicus]
MAATLLAGSWGCIPETQEPGLKSVPRARYSSRGPRPSHVCTPEKLVIDTTYSTRKGGVHRAGPALVKSL